MWIEYVQALHDPHVIVAVGIPGSGKTTLLHPFAVGAAYKYVSLDTIREDATGDASDLSQDELVVRLAQLRMQYALEFGRSIVFDATNTAWCRRQSLVATLRQWGAKAVVAVWFDVSLELAKQRVKQRGRPVPNEQKFAADMARMQQRLVEHPPTVDEGFDRVFKV